MYRNVVLSVCIFTLLVAAAPPAAGAINDGLVAFFRLDETSGTVAEDSSGNGHDGTLLGVGATWVEGRDEGSLMLTGVDTDGRLEYSTAGMSTATGTVCMWGYLSDPQPETDGRYFFGHTTQPQFSNRIQIYMQEGTTPSTLLDIGLGSSHTTRTDILEVPLEEWVHVGMTWDNGNYAVYFNGEEVSNGSYSGLTDLDAVANVGNDGSSAPYEAFGGMLDDARIYNRALTAAEMRTIYQTPAASRFVAQDPSPANQATDIPIDTMLAWTASEFAVAHDVYFGASFDDVNNASRDDPMGVLVSEGQAATTYDPSGMIEYGVTYYWRIDEVNAAPDNTIFKGTVWSFSSEPVGYPIEGVIATTNGIPQQGANVANIVNGAGLNENDEHSTEATDMWLGAGDGVDPVWIQFEFDRVYKMHELWVWNYNIQFEPVLGFGVKDATVEYSVDGTEWVVLGDAEFAQAAATAAYAHNTAVDLGGIMAKYIRLTINSGFGVLGQFGLSEVRFFQIPASAREPQPADGDTGVDPDTLLGWRAGRGAVTHDVSFGTDADALAVVDTVSDSTYDPGALDLGTTYYWKVDEVNEAAAPAKVEGDVWSFATQEYFVIDDFESYNDDDNTIFDTWLDGFVNETGSTVGYFQAPFAEQTIVNSGGQSMPLEYANNVAPFYSEAEYDLGGMDLDTNGADTLRLFVAGQAPAFAETADGAVVMNAIGTDIWNAADEFRYAYKTLNGDGSMVARVDSLVDSDVWAKGGVMIRETTDAGSAFAAVYMTGDNGVRFQGRLATDASAVSDTSVATAEQIALREPAWVKIERVGNAFNGYYSTDGENWVDMTWNPQTIDMAASVTIGLALTSHNATVATSAAFAGVAESGGVSGTWQVAEIGVAQPVAGNDIEPLYVALEDTSGSVAVVTHPNPVAVGIEAWQEWLIPYSDLSGINLNRVAFMYIGVGDRDNPTAGGAGLIFIDDIMAGRQAVK